MATSDLIVFLLVVLARLVVPLFIPRYPIPSMIAAMLIDAADQTIYQKFTSLNLEHYQSYDKALDIYYLAIAYLSTMRNWGEFYAFKVSRFLYFYRLVGATAFELSGFRVLLLIFPNTFEYFYDWYEAVRLRWNVKRLNPKLIFRAAAFIWIFIKLPQEYWIHVAQLDTTDLIKKDILGVPTDTPWGEAIRQNLWVIPVLLLIAALLVLVVVRIRRRLPEPDWDTAFDVDVHQEPVPQAVLLAHQPTSIRHGLLEKIVLVGLVTIIFSQLVPDLAVSNLGIFAGVAFVIVINAIISQWLALRGREWRSMIQEFLVMAVINLAVGCVGLWLLPSSADDVQLAAPVLFTLLLTLIVTFYDRYRPIHDARLALADAERPGPAGAAVSERDPAALGEASPAS